MIFYLFNCHAIMPEVVYGLSKIVRVDCDLSDLHTEMSLKCPSFVFPERG